jgi:S1-C subfamily serine protease
VEPRLKGRPLAVSVIATLTTLLLAAFGPAEARTTSQPATGVLRISVTLADAARTPTPVPRHALLISDNPATAEPRQVVTRLDGTIDVTLRAGSYIVESDRPVMFQGRGYRWTQTVDVAAGREVTLALTIDNAEVEADADPSTKLDDDAAFLLPQLSESVVELWTPTAHASGFVIDGKGLVVTNQQVVRTATMVEVQLSPSVKVAARVLAADAAKDVAVLRMDPSVAPSVRAGRPACGPEPATPLAVGQPLVAIGVTLRQQKEILSAKVGAIEPGGIVSDLVPATGSLGGPVFTPRGEFVGLTSTVPDKDPDARLETRVVRAADVCSVVAAAPAMEQGPRPSAVHLPVERVIPVPVKALEAAAAKRGGSLNPYVVTGSAFEAAFITPMATFGTEYQAEQLRARKRAGNARLLDAGPPPNPLLEFSNWSDYVWDFPPVLLVRVTPKLVERFWTTVGRAAAMTQGVALPPIKRFKSGFSRLQAYCGDVEVTPIHPFKLERRTSETEAIYEGLYVYDLDALGPQCPSVKLVMYSEKEPDKGDSRVVDPAIVRQVWEDFAPYRAAASAQDQRQPAWRRTDSARFEIHYPPALAGELGRVVRSAERAYDRVGGRLDFTLRTKVPLVLFAPAGPIPREQVVAYAVSDDVAPQHPHRSRIVVPVPDDAGELDALLVHELTHLLVGEVILPSQPGTGGLPRWVLEGAATYMVGVWREDDERLMRELVASGDVPALSRLSGDGGFADPRVNDALGHAAFDYIERRWGPGGLRRFVNGLVIPRVDRTYDAVLDLTPAAFDAAFQQYAADRFGPARR